MFSSSAYSPNALRTAPDARTLIENAHRQMRSSSLGKLAEVVFSAVKGLPSSQREALGFDDRGPSYEVGEKIIERLTQKETPDIYLLFTGARRKDEERPWVLGDPSTGRLVGLILFTTERPLKETDEVLFLRPGAHIGSWDIDRLPGALFRIPGLVPAPPPAEESAETPEVRE